MMKTPIFPVEFQSMLEYGKYTRWVLWREFSADHLLCLLCMIGEFDARASAVMRLLERHWPSLTYSEHRAILALEAIRCIARGERFDRFEWARRQLRGRIPLEAGDLPEPVRAALGQTAPGATWDLVMMIPEGYEIGGKNAAGQSIYAYFSPQGALIHTGPERRRGEAAKPSIFPAWFAQALERSSRAWWAVARGFSEDYLLCLLWLVGEFEVRSAGMLPLLEQGRTELPDAGRAIMALLAMRRMACMVSSISERFDVDELERRIDRGRAHLEFDDLPEPVRAALEAASPGTQWQGVWMIPEAYELWGYERGAEGTTGRLIEASASPHGTVVLKRSISRDGVPAAAASAIKARFPEFRPAFVHGRLSDGGTIHAYEFELVSSGGRARRIVISPEGREISETLG